MAEKFKVLMIDDEADILDFFGVAFKHFKHIEFLTSERATEGIEIAKRERPDVISLDLRMPGMNGEEALAELKKFLPETKFIVMTGWEDGILNGELKAMGISAYYSKPMDLERVVTKIMNLLMVKDRGSHG